MAAQTPSGTPTSTATMMATVASSSVAGKKRAMSCVTGFEVITERPRSPLTICPRYFQNWM
ncbi:hypothetical protein [Teichococcus aestuarii]